MNANELNGFIPLSIASLSNLRTLDLSSNRLVGQIPFNLGNLVMLSELNLSRNVLVGQIPTLSNVSVIDLSINYLTGPIPKEIMNIWELHTLKLNNNSLTGSIPNFCNRVIFPENLDLSFNQLHGEVPFCRLSSWNFRGNRGPCGEMIGLEECNTTQDSPSQDNCFLRIIIPVSIYLAFLCLGYLLFFYTCMVKKHKPIATEAKNGDYFSIWNYDGKIAFEDMIKATEDFDMKYCIGTGGYGSVYKARLPSGKVVAVKKLHHSDLEESVHVKSFENEACVLSEIRHRSIVKLVGYCVHKQCMFLVYEYMERGSLFRLLRIDEEAIELGWNQRINIIRRIANALAYLHHGCYRPIVHRDISTGNILLNSKSEAFVGDFGLARLLQPDSSNITALAGTYGYIAPGYYTSIHPLFSK